MYDNFIFSVSSALPIFLVMFTGYVLKRRKIIDENFIRQSNKMVFMIALPIKLFTDVSKTSFNGGFDWRFISFIVIGTLFSLLLSSFVAFFVAKKPSQKGVFLQGAFRGNFLYVGYSLLENVLGSVGTKAPLAIAFVIPLYNILAVMVLSYYGTSEDAEVDFKLMLRNIMRNPLILSIFAGVLFSLSGLQLPDIADRTLSYFGVLVTPLALITIGGAFKFEKIKQSFSVALMATLLKLLILPLGAVFFAIRFGFSGEEIFIIYIIFGVPTAASSYIMAKEMDGDEDLASGIIMLTTLFSNITMTLFIFYFVSSGIL